MATAAWPPANDREIIGKRVSRIDGPVKSTGFAKYAYDINRPGMLYAKLLFSPHGHARIQAIDVSGAESLAGVRAVKVYKDAGAEVMFCGDIVAALAADTEEIAKEALSRIKVSYELLPVNLDDRTPGGREPSIKEEGAVEQALSQAAKVVEGRYGAVTIAHCCHETHGQVCEFRDGELYVWCSTQSVSQYGEGLRRAAELESSQIHVDCQYMGGGFGSKFGSDEWGSISVELAKQTGKPVKLMLERDIDLMAAGARPSAYATIRTGVNAEGDLIAWDSDVVGSGGINAGTPPPLPYIFTRIPNRREKGAGVATHRGAQRAWRAPRHPQACLLTMAAIEDAAAAIGMDALEFFMRNLKFTDREDVYRQELQIAADMIGYKQKAHPRGDQTPGPVKRGLGISIHTWGGAGHESNCDVTIYADGSVDVKCGTQDLGTGTRTVIGIVVAETLGLPLEAVKVNIGSNAYPASGASGGSTTVGGVSSSSRQAATDALNQLLAKVAPSLGVSADNLVTNAGKIHDVNDPAKAISWKDACGMLGPASITGRGKNVTAEGVSMGLISSGVGGVQIADVSVDIETGVATLNELVAVQDCGLIIDLKTAESQVYGGVIMGITYALFEECVYDPNTGQMLNPDMEFYRLAGFADIGRIKVHMMTGPGFDERGVIGLGEPPVISPGAAISNAVANAIGVRVPDIPLTPERILAALSEGGIRA